VRGQGAQLGQQDPHSVVHRRFPAVSYRQNLYRERYSRDARLKDQVRKCEPPGALREGGTTETRLRRHPNGAHARVEAFAVQAGAANRALNNLFPEGKRKTSKGRSSLVS